MAARREGVAGHCPFALFTRWFTVEGYSVVEDAGQGRVEDEPADGLYRLAHGGQMGLRGAREPVNSSVR